MLSVPDYTFVIFIGIWVIYLLGSRYLEMKEDKHESLSAAMKEAASDFFEEYPFPVVISEETFNLAKTMRDSEDIAPLTLERLLANVIIDAYRTQNPDEEEED